MKKTIVICTIFCSFTLLSLGQVSSNFATNADGWTIFNTSSGASSAATYNAGGYITDGGTFSGPTILYAEAPAKFRGNFSSSYNQNITFDLKTDFVGTNNTNGDVMIAGTGGTLYYQLPAKPGTTFTPYVIQLNETFAGWHFNGTATAAPTQTQMKAVLSNITSFRIRTKYTTANTTTATGSLDNVVLNVMPLVAPPIITSFTPKFALPGAVITITGLNFNTTASQNIVYFNSVKVVPSSATATQLVVSAPARGAYGQLVVENLGTGLQGVSTQSFSLLFDNNKDFGGRIIPASMSRGHYNLLKHGAESNNFLGNTDKGDLDGDGWIDLVVTEISTATIYYYRNLGTGGSVSASFFAPAVALSIATIPGGSPNLGELTLADVDSDGKLDVVAISSNGGIYGYLAVFRNTSTVGSISFSSPLFFSYPYYSAQLFGTSGDFDGDGRIDFAYTTGTSPGGIWVNQNLSSPGNVDFSYGFSVGNNASHTDITTSDLNADGKPEIIAPSGTSIEIYQNASVAGSIAMNAPFTIPAVTSGVKIAVADLDADNKLDFAWSAYGSQYIYFSKNIFSGPTFDATSFGSTIQIQNTLSNPEGIAVSDINADGKPDLVISGYADLGIMQNAGTTGALSATSFLSPTLFQGSAGAQAISLAAPIVADLDGDNKPEVAAVYTNSSVTVAEKGIYIFHNESFPAPFISSTTPTSGITGTSVALNGNFMFTGNVSPSIRLNKFLSNITGSPSNTLTTTTTPSAGTSGKFNITNHGLTAISPYFTKTFATTKVINTSSFGPSVDFTLAGNTRDALEIADFDDDGKMDVVAIDNYSTAKVFQNSATAGQPITSASLSLQGTTYTGGYNVIVLDVDGDGKVDLNNGYGLLQNNSTPGSISFLSGPNGIYTNAGGFNYVASADFNKDGKIDLAVTNGTANVQLYENESSRGVYVNIAGLSTYNATAVNLTRPSNYGGIVAEDFDGDGYDDIAVATPFTNNFTFYQNLKLFGSIKASSFSAGTTTATALTPTGITANDFDGDGKIDLAISFNNDNVAFVSVYRNTSTVGAISFAANIDLPCLKRGYNIASQDLDGDGKAEIVVIHRPNPGPGSFSVLQNKSTSGAISFNSAVNYSLASPARNPQAVAIADINQDEKPDILIVGDPYTAPTNALMVFENKLSNGPVITVTLQPLDAIVCEGTVATFTTDATGTTNITYQWQFSPNTGVFTDIADGTNYTGTATKTLSVNTTASFGVGRYRCKVSGDLALTVNTNDEGLFVNAIPAAPTTIGDSDCVPASLTLSASGGSNGQYRWYTVATGGTADASQKNSTFNTPVISTTTTYYVSINNGSCEGSRTPAVATISPLIKPTLQSSSPIVGGVINICVGDALTLTGPSGFATYMWSNGATTNPITVTTSTSSLTLQVKDGSGCTSPSSDALNIVVNPYPAAIITVNGTQLTASPGDSYQWYQNNDPISGETSQSFEFNILEYGLYEVEVTDNGCTSTSAPFEYLITGAEKFSDGLKVFPNPVNDDLFIEFNPPYTIRVIDGIGNILKSSESKSKSTKLPLASMVSGTYFIQIKNENQTHYIRIIKN